MKLCPKCEQTYTDETLNFCLEDGEWLIGSTSDNDPTTAVQAIDQIEDLLRRLIRKELESAHIRDSKGNLRLILLLPSWEDYLSLAFDEIRQFGTNSVQVVRRLRSALSSLADNSPTIQHDTNQTLAF